MTQGRYFRRRLKSTIFLCLSVVATFFGLGWLALILGTLVYEGFSGIDLALFTEFATGDGGFEESGEGVHASAHFGHGFCGHESLVRPRFRLRTSSGRSGGPGWNEPT